METPAAPLELDDPHRVAGIRRLATYTMFEHMLADADAGKCTRERALGRVAALYPLIMSSEVKA